MDRKSPFTDLTPGPFRGPVRSPLASPTLISPYPNIANRTPGPFTDLVPAVRHPTAVDNWWIDVALPYLTNMEHESGPVANLQDPPPATDSTTLSEGGVLHVSTSTSEYPTPLAFQCPHYRCRGRRFETKEALERHSRAHRSGKSYTCQYCQKKFSRMHNLQNHLKIHGKRGSALAKATPEHAINTGGTDSRRATGHRDSFVSLLGTSPTRNNMAEPADDIAWHQDMAFSVYKPISGVELDRDSARSGEITDTHVTTTIRAGSPSPDPASYPPLRPDAKVVLALSHVFGTSEKRRKLLKLVGDDAQVIVDFLQSVLLHPESMAPSILEQTLFALYKLVKSSKLHPQCYVIRDVTLDSPEDGGGFCDIYKGYNGNQRLCIKVVRIFQKSDTDAALKVFAKEAILWGQLHHPNIVPFRGIYYLDEARKRICLVSPWMNNGNLVQYLKTRPDEQRKPFIYDVALGVEYLHRKNIVHGDLKGVNILVDNDRKACITDFGLSSIRSDKTFPWTNATTTMTGCSFRWAAPELLEENPATRASDIWAFASVCYEIMTRTFPFHEYSNDSKIIMTVLKGGLPTRPLENSVLEVDQIDDKMWDLMKWCWNHDTTLRPNAVQILEELGVEVIKGRDVTSNAGILSAISDPRSVSIDLVKVERILNEL